MALLNLPIDIIERILKEVDVFDIGSFRKSSPIIREISDSSKALWVWHVNNLVYRWIPVPLPKTDTLDACSISEVRDAVLRAAYLAENWSEQSPRLVSSVKESEFKLGPKDLVDIVANFLVISNRESMDRLIIYDIKDCSYLGQGLFEYDAKLGDEVFFYIKGCCRIHYFEDTVQLFCAICSTSIENGQHERHPRLKPFETIIAKGSNFLNTFKFNEITKLPIDYVGPPELDPTLKLLLFSHYLDDGNFHLNVHHCGTKEIISVIVDNEITSDSLEEIIPFFPGRNEIFCRSIRPNRETVTSISIRPNHSHSDAHETSVYQTRNDYTFQIDYGIEELEDTHDNPGFSRNTFFHYPWNSEARHYETSTDRPHALYSSYQFFWDRCQSWFVIQYYWSADGPYGKQRCVIRPHRGRRHRATNFRHIVWIEEKDDEVDTSDEPTTSSSPDGSSAYPVGDGPTRQLMLVTFPPPVENPEEITEESIIELKPVKLDVPTHILHNVKDIFLSESEGVIVIVSREGKVYLLQYA